jgi:hypothetical protein
MDDPAEEWKPVVGYEGWYEVSNLGRVKRVMPGKGTKRPILSPYTAKVGYKMVTLSHGTIPTRKKWYVHHLVTEAFQGPRPPDKVVNHKDAEKVNNLPVNLEYVPQRENVQHACRLGLHPRGERNGHAKLTEEDVREIRELRGAFTVRELGELYGINSGSISDIQNRKRWRHVT